MHTNQNHRIGFAMLAVAGFLAASALPAVAQHNAHAAPAQQTTASLSATETTAALRDLWVGHIFWVRSVVTATLANDTAARTASDKAAVANARQIANSIAPFYGQAAADKLFGLLAGHYGAVKQYLDAGTDKAKQDAAVKALTDNAGEIATFLSGANPNLPKAAVLSLLAAHGGHHVTQIQQLRAKQYDQEAETWEEMKGHMYTLSDTLAGAIAKQFPDKFAAAAR
jgi:hypothetical protein